jgi:hypothetical protein
MAVPAGKAPILESVGAAIRLWRAALPHVWGTAVLGGALLAAVQVAAIRFAGDSVGGPFMTLVVGGAIGSFVYATLLHPPLEIAEDGARRIGDGLRVYASMAVIGFFLTLIFFVGLMGASMILGAAFAPYAAEFEAARNNEAETLALAERFAQENPALIALLALVFAAAWLALTSRLYLAAPATVADQRVRTFETWNWTKDNMLRICAARLLLLVPAGIVASLLQAAIGAALGIAPLDPFAGARVLQADPTRYLLYFIPAQIISLLLYRGLEAGLSAYLYKGLKPR